MISSFPLLVVLFSLFASVNAVPGVKSTKEEFSNKADASLKIDMKHLQFDATTQNLDSFLSTVGPHIFSAEDVVFLGLANKQAEVVMKKLVEVKKLSKTCSIKKFWTNGIHDMICPSMQGAEKKRPCKMARDAYVRQMTELLADCPIESFSIEGNKMSGTLMVELVQNITNGLFPSLTYLSIDDNILNYDSVLTVRLTNMVNELPKRVTVRSFYTELQNVIVAAGGGYSPFRYNFADRYPAECHFYSEPIRDPEFDLLIRYTPCIYSTSFISHGTAMGAKYVTHMTRVLGESKYPWVKEMEIFGNEIGQGDYDTFMTVFTPDRFPVLTKLEMSSNALPYFAISKDFVPTLEELMLDTNNIVRVDIPEGALPNLRVLRLGTNELTTLSFGKGCLPNLQKLFLDSAGMTLDLMSTVANATFAPSIRHLSMFNNPLLGENPMKFMKVYKGILNSGSFENISHLLLGNCGLKSICEDLKVYAEAKLKNLKHFSCF